MCVSKDLQTGHKSAREVALQTEPKGRFANQEDFVKKMRESRFEICMAVADKNASGWKNMKGIDLRKDLSKEVSDPDILEVLIECGYLTKRKRQVTQKMIDAYRDDRKSEVIKRAGTKSLVAIDQAITEVFKAIGNGDDSYSFLRNKFISKVTINDLSDTFRGLLEDKVKFKIMPVPV